MNDHQIKKSALILSILFSSIFIATPTLADSTSTTTTTSTTATNPDGSTTTTVKETVDTPQAQETTTVAPAAVGGRNIVGPTGVTGTIRRSDRRQDRRSGDPRLGHDDDIDINRSVHRDIDRR